MRAVLCREWGGTEKLVVEETAPLMAGPGQVVVQVKACGLNYADGLIIRGKYQEQPAFPFSPGVEAAGIVKSVGAGVTHLKPGMRAAVHPHYGAFAEEVVTEAHRIFPIPDSMDFATAAAFPIAYGTSYHALKDRAQLAKGETLVVLGAAGGIGLTAVELGHAMGARVIAAASTDEKLALCRKYGADELINYSTEDIRQRLKELTRGRGPDVIYDPVGGPYTEPVLRSLAPHGRYLVLGFAAGDIPKIPLNLLLLKRISLVGAFWGSDIDQFPAHHTQNVAELFELYVAGKLKPLISARYPLEKAGEAIDYLWARKAQGKVILDV